MSEDPGPWLSAAQQRAWRAFLEGSIRLHDTMDRDLKLRHGITEPEFEIMVQLSETPEHRLRMADLAELVSQSRSRLSHTCSRMETKDLIRRTTCAGDKRGIFAELTDEGFAVLRKVAPDHVRTVRANFIDIIDPDDLEAIGRAFGIVSRHLGPMS